MKEAVIPIKMILLHRRECYQDNEYSDKRILLFLERKQNKAKTVIKSALPKLHRYLSSPPTPPPAQTMNCAVITSGLGASMTP